MRKCLELKLKGGVLSLYLIVFKFIIISVISWAPIGRELWSVSV